MWDELQIHVTAHALGRFHERVRPGAGPSAVEDLVRQSPDPPPALGDARVRAGPYVVVVERTSKRWVRVVTVLKPRGR